MNLRSFKLTASLLVIFLAVAAFFVPPAFAVNTSITYTNIATQRTVKPTQTKFTNNTDKTINLQHSGSDTVIAQGQTSAKISKKIVSIKYGSTVYYSANPNDYTIPSGKTATVSKKSSNLTMSIPN